MALILLAIFLVAPVLVVFAVQRLRLQSTQQPGSQALLRKPPGPPPHWLFGNVLELARAPGRAHFVIQRWVQDFGRILTLKAPGRTVYVVTDPDAIPELSKLPKSVELPVYRLAEMGRPNILTSASNDYWKAVRRATVNAFASANLKHYLSDVVQLAVKTADALQAANAAAAIMDVTSPAAHDGGNTSHNSGNAGDDGGISKGCVWRSNGGSDNSGGGVVYHDIDLWAQRLTVDVMGLFTFGMDFEATTGRNDEACEVVEDWFKGIQHQQNSFNRLKFWNKEAKMMNASRQCFMGILERCMADVLPDGKAQGEVQPGRLPPTSLFAHLLKVINPATGKPLEHTHLLSELSVFYFAGFETTAHAIGFLLMYFASSTEAQAKAAGELSRLGLLAEASNNYQPRTLEWGDLAKLHYINAAIQESLRLMPPASGGTARTVPHDMSLLGYHVPKGTTIITPFYSIQRNERNWPQANEFLPERWLSPSLAATIAQQALPPLGSSGSSGNSGDAAAEAVRAAGSKEAAAATAVAVTGTAALAMQRDGGGGSGDSDLGHDQGDPDGEYQEGKGGAVAGAAGQVKPTPAGANGADNGAIAEAAAAASAAAADTTMGLDQAPGMQNSKAWLPFSFGSRNCVGMSLALMELRVVAAVLLGRFEFELDPELGGRAAIEANARQYLTLKPGHPLLMRAKPRAEGGAA